MKLNTSRFGEIDISEELIFELVEPILGYDSLTKFVLIDNAPESPFKWFQSAENGDIAFPVSFPALFGIDYEFVIPDDKSEKLGLKGVESLITFNIVCIPPGKVEDATINLAGPIIINAENKKGMQLVLGNIKYSVKQRLFPKQPSKQTELESAPETAK